MRHGLIPVLTGVAIVLGSSRASAQDRVRAAELTPKAEAAIEKGLKYLAKVQNADGSWDQMNQPAITALSLMAFMVKGHFPDQEPYGETMAKGVDYLLKQVKRNNGYMGKSMYEHGLATLALSEVWGESSRSEEIREGLKKAVAVIVKAQSPAGGWRYQPDGHSHDMSVTVMQIVALASAKEAGILVPDKTIERAVSYVKYCQNDGGSFGYTGPGDGPGNSGFGRGGAGVTSLQMCGHRKSKEVARGLEYLRSLGDDPFEKDSGYPWFYYGHYYAALAMYQASEKDHQAWYPKIRDALVRLQSADGSWEGGIPSQAQNGYCTPMAIVILGVPYRFLPIYQR